MRSFVLAALAAAPLFATPAAQAQTYSGGPVCLHVYGPVSYYECNYTSLAQCNASASGRAAECVLNPYAARIDGPPVRYRQHRHAY